MQRPVIKWTSLILAVLLVNCFGMLYYSSTGVGYAWLRRTYHEQGGFPRQKVSKSVRNVIGFVLAEVLCNVTLHFIFFVTQVSQVKWTAGLILSLAIEFMSSSNRLTRFNFSGKYRTFIIDTGFTLGVALIRWACCEFIG